MFLIGLYWAHSHFSDKLLQKTRHGYNLLSIGVLAAASITPFRARPLFKHLSGNAERRTAALVYLGVTGAPATWWFVRWIYATARRLTDQRLADAYLKRLTIKYGVSALAYWAAFALTFWNWTDGIVAAGIVSLSDVVPPAKPIFKHGQMPAQPCRLYSRLLKT